MLQTMEHFSNKMSTYLYLDIKYPPKKEPMIEIACPITPIQNVVSDALIFLSTKNKGSIPTAPCSPETNDSSCKPISYLVVDTVT